MRSLILCASLVAALVSAAPSGKPNTHTLHQKRDTESSPWVKRSRVESSALLAMRIALTQSNLDKGPDWVMDVSDPRSANFGRHWTEEDVNRAFAPSDETVKNVADWLIASGINADDILHSDNKGWLEFEISASMAEDLFKTELYEHEHSTTGKLSIASDEYYLPDHLIGHVDYITPGVVPRKMKKSSLTKRSTGAKGRPGRMPWFWPQPPAPPVWQWWWQNPPPPFGNLPSDIANCSTWITPPCVRALYNIPPASDDVDPSNAIGVFEEYDTYSQEDLNDYFTTFLPNIPNGTHPTPQYIDGAVAPVPVQDAGGESDLDLTILYSLVYPQNIDLYQTDDPYWANQTLNGGSDGFLDTFLDAIDGSFCTYSAYGQTGDNSTLDPTYPDPNPGGYKGQLQCGVYKPTNVISISYLSGEGDGTPINYQERQCNEYMKLALQGVTILFASGDYGVAGFPDPPEFPTGTCQGPNNNVFLPAFPATCPWVTSVGATQIPVNGTVYDQEVAADTLFAGNIPFTSGGGFSNIFPIPDYQTAAVAEYFAISDPPYPYYETLRAENIGANGGIYNRIGRGFPDISAVGAFWLDFVQGEEAGYGGTSMATPIVASVVNRIIEERLKIGKGPIGFLNPTLYSNPELLNDITQGHNLGCGTQGFNAAPGWDPVTGMGTPNYPALLAYYLLLP